MLGACGAIMGMTAGAALGIALRECRYNRLRLLENELEVLARMRLTLLEERWGLGQLLLESADAGGDEGAFAKRLRHAAKALETDPLTPLSEAYQSACRAWPVRCEQVEEKRALEALFAQLGAGTAAMREQAVASAMRRLRPLSDAARASAQRGGKLFLQMGVLLGLMAGIALW